MVFLFVQVLNWGPKTVKVPDSGGQTKKLPGGDYPGSFLEAS